MSASVNKVQLIGRLTKDPEAKSVASGLDLTTFSVAVDRRPSSSKPEPETDFFDCKVFRNAAQYLAKYGKKGRLVYVEGRIEIGSFTGQDGVKRKTVDVVADDVKLLDRADNAAQPSSDSDPLESE